MPQPGLLPHVVLGQLVHLRTDPVDKRGNIIAVLMTQLRYPIQEGWRCEGHDRKQGCC